MRLSCIHLAAAIALLTGCPDRGPADECEVDDDCTGTEVCIFMAAEGQCVLPCVIEPTDTCPAGQSCNQCLGSSCPNCLDCRPGCE